MILPLALFRFRPGTNLQLIEAAGAALTGLQGRIPKICAIHWGRNLAPGSTEYTHGLSVTLADPEALKRYREHPAHQAAVATNPAPIRQARWVADLEV